MSNTHSTPDLLAISAPVALEAADGTKPRKLKITAYGGGIIDPMGWGETLVDLAGMSTPASVPILVDHENTVDSIVGTGRPSTAGGKLTIDAIAAGSDRGSQIVALLESGMPLQASIGAKPIRTRFIREGEKVTANGRTHTASANGLAYVEQCALREISIVAVGGDAKTEVSLAAKAAHGVRAMPETKEPPADPAVQEEQRIADIRAAKAPEDLELRAIGEGWSRDQLNAAMLTRLRASAPKPPAAGRPMPDGADAKSLLSCALLLRSGQTSVAEKAFDARVVQAAADLRCRSLVDVCERALLLSHIETPMGRNEMIQAAFSTSALSGALRESITKTALARYRESPATWRNIAKTAPVRDFKPAKAYRMILGGNFSRVPPAGELKHAFLDSESFQIQADTSGLMVGITRTDIINDDASLLSDTGPALGAAGARAVSDEVYHALLANLEPDGITEFFTTARGNLREGVNTALSLGAVSAAVAAMVSRTDAEGRNIDVRPKTLLLPPELEAYGRQIVTSTLVARAVGDGVDQAPQGNPLAGLLDVVAEPRLSNANITGYSLTGWYLFSQPGDGAIVVAFLDGRDGPVVEEVQGPPEVLGQFWRAYIDFGVSLGDWRAATKVTGVVAEG